MSTNVEVLSNQAIPRDALITFLRSAGASQLADPHQTVYVLGKDKAHVWIYLDNPEPRYPDPAVDARVKALLGSSSPTFRLLLEISREEGSEQLAIDLILRFAEHWPCVVDNLSGLARRVYTVDDLRRLQREGRGLRYDDRFVPLPEDDPGEEFMDVRLEDDEE